MLGWLGAAAASRAQPGRTDEAPRADPAALCGEAVRAAERRYRLPPGLLWAISQVESGRPDPATRRRTPWPWTVQAEDRGLYFDSKAEAVRWVREATARGVTSIDAGCLQVNLHFHPRAFETLDAAFDPGRNADYAARFLRELHVATGDWGQATGFYHSQTTALATPYRERVARALGDPLPSRRPPTILDQLSAAWGATLEGDASAPEPHPPPAWSAAPHARPSEARQAAAPERGRPPSGARRLVISPGAAGCGSLCERFQGADRQ